MRRREGREEEFLKICTDVYGWHREVRAKQQEVVKLKAELAKVKGRLSEEKMKKKPGGHDDLQGMVGGRPAEDGAGGVEGLMEGLHNLVAMLVKDHDRRNHK